MTAIPQVNDDNRIVRGLWVEGRLSELERLCIRSFCANGHEFHLYHYGELSNLPKADGFRLMDAADILPPSAIFYHHKNQSVANFADYFRWELMRQKGGWYADMDIVCLRPFGFDKPVVLGYAFDGSINNALMKFPRGHTAAAAIADTCAANINQFAPWDTPSRKWKKIKRILRFRNDHKYMKWGEAGGPDGLTLAIKYFGLTDCVMPPHTLYVQSHPLTRSFFDDSIHKLGLLDGMLSAAYAVHVTNITLSGRGINKDDSFAEYSPFEELKRRYPEPS